MKVHIQFVPVFLLGLAIGAAFSYMIPKFVSMSHESPADYKAEIVLSGTYDDGVSRETGLRVPFDPTGTYSQATTLKLSPDHSRVVYTTWDAAHVVIYVSGVDGKNSKKVAEQIVPEGSGELNADSIVWSDDGKRIIYFEIGLACEGTCQNPNDLVSMKTTYQVDVETGEKLVLDKQKT